MKEQKEGESRPFSPCPEARQFSSFPNIPDVFQAAAKYWSSELVSLSGSKSVHGLFMRNSCTLVATHLT